MEIGLIPTKYSISYSIFYWEVFIHFLGGEKRTNFLLCEFFMGSNFYGLALQGGKLFRENFYREFVRIPLQNFFMCLAFCLPIQYYAWRF